MRKRKTAPEAVREFLEAGRTGTAEAIAQSLGVAKNTVEGALRGLRRQQIAEVIGTEKRDYPDREREYGVAVWGLCQEREATPTLGLVAIAVMNRHPLEQAWMGSA